MVFVDDASDLIGGGAEMDWFFADLTANDPDRDTVIGRSFVGCVKRTRADAPSPGWISRKPVRQREYA